MSGAVPTFQISGNRPANLRLIDSQTLRGLSARSNGAGAIRLAVHLSALSGGAALVWLALDSLWLLPAMLIQGLTLVSLFAAIHECIHATAFKSRRINQLVAWLVALPTLLNADFYRLFHMAHHKHCQDPDKDPELQPPPPTSQQAYLWRITGLPYWIARVSQLFGLARGRFAGYAFILPEERDGIRRSVQGNLAVYAVVLAASIWFQSLAALWFWILPVLLARPFLQLYLLSEHTGCSADDNVLTNTRTTLALWPIRLLMWNMPYHTAHHLYPQIPFHALPAAQKLLSDSPMVSSSGYLTTNWKLFRAVR